MNAGSVHDVLRALDMRLSPSETKFLKDLPPLIDGSIRGAVINALEPSSRSRINFDIAYRSVRTGYELTVSAPKRTGQIDVLLVAPEPRAYSASRGRSKSQIARSKSARQGKVGAKRRPTVRNKRTGG